MRLQRPTVTAAVMAAMWAVVGCGAAPASVSPARSGPLATPGAPTLYVVGYSGPNYSGTVTPINTAANEAEQTIKVGSQPTAIVVAPDGKTAYVANQNGTVTPITTATNQPGQPIKVGGDPILSAIAITPDGKTAYVVGNPRGQGCHHPLGNGDGFVVPIATATNKPAEPISVGHLPVGLAITPDGKTIYVPNSGDNTVTPIATATNAARRPIPIGNAGPVAILVAPGGRSAYAVVVSLSGRAFPGSLIPIAIGTNTPGNPIGVGDHPMAIAITPSAKTPYTETLAANSVLGFFAACTNMSASP
jgi:hyaluronoglucosaminidase